MAYERRSFSPAAAPTTLSTDISDSAASINVDDGSTYVDGTLGASVLTIDRGNSNEERILYTDRVGNTFSGLTRGYDGTAAHEHTSGASVEHTSTRQDYDEANAHIADPTLDHHTQYARKAAPNKFIGGQLFGSITASVIDSGHEVTFTTDDTGHVPVGIKAAAFQAADVFHYVDNGNVQLAALSASGGWAAAGGDHFFGANALGGSGSRIHLGSLGDPNNAYVVGEGSGSDVNLVMRPQGSTGYVSVQTSSGTATAFVAGAVSGNPANPGVGFFGAGPTGKVNITGSRGGNAALGDLLAKLASYGLITDSSSA